MTGGSTDSEAPSISIGHVTQDYGDGADVSLHVEYNWTTSYVLNPGDGSGTQAEDGQMWVVFHIRVHNEGEQDREAATRQYTLEIDSTIYEVVAFDAHALRGMSLPAGGTAEGYIAFQVPEGASMAYLQADPGRLGKRLTVSFTHDEDLRARFPDS